MHFRIPLAFTVLLSSLLSFADEPSLTLKEVLVISNTSYANTVTDSAMLAQQSSLTSVNDVIDNLPGVSVNEGDAYGFDDYSTSITLRGFRTNVSEQQIGMTIDGMPNGNANYGGGAKANRYIDPANLAGVDISQGAADIASRSNEALGGTLNFKTSDPLTSRRLRFESTVGSFDAKRLYARYDTGVMGVHDTRAWFSASHQDATDWINASAENTRDHFAAKLLSSFERVNLTAYVSYDDVHEDNYQNIYSAEQYQQNPDSDGLTSRWTSVPFEDQLYRQGWSTLRENKFGYLKMDIDVNEHVDLSAAVYHHGNKGRGDWLPPYLTDATLDAAGQSEYLGGSTRYGTPTGFLGQFFFVDANGQALAPDITCTPSYTVTNLYGQATATAPIYADPSCYPAGAIAVQSMRHTHYQKDRSGLNLDGVFNLDTENVYHQVRAGLWYEDQTRDESRDWHNVSTTQGFVANETPYWVQYDRRYAQKTSKWYVQDALSIGNLSFNFGAKQFLVDLKRKDRFDTNLNASINSDSAILFSGGVVWETPLDGMEAFLGYAENYKALSDLILENPAADFSQVEPETAKNYELGLRYNAAKLNASAVYFTTDFNNRIFYLPNNLPGVGPDFMADTNGSWFNAGGINTKGLELAARYQMNHHFNAYAAYTYIDATYVGSGDTVVDTVNGITPGSQVAGIPKNMFVATLNWQHDNAFASLSAKYTGKRAVNTTNTWTADAYTITDLRIGYDFKNRMGGQLKKCRVNLIVNNLFNQQYLGTIAQNVAWLGGERSVALSGTVDF